jgi:saccharopine dehydrogenase-like NADP-dependent oxidoreductase
MTLNRTVTVFGAYGHTGKFVVRELLERGLTPILSGRDVAKLRAMRDVYPELEVRATDVENLNSLEAAMSGSSTIINCAGPFLDTAIPIIEVAIRSGVHYLDVAAEQAAVVGVFQRFEHDPRTAGVVVAPAMAFYGGLSDLLATAAMGDWDRADEVCIAVALDSWKPTLGTRLTGQRNPGQRFIFSNNKLERADPPPGRKWNFPPPFGEQDVVPLSLSESITISRHLRTPEIRVFMNVAPLTDLRNPDTPVPTPANESGRSAQVFLVDVIVHNGSQERRIVASGRDIYAITAPIVVEAAERIVKGLVEKMGVVAAGEAFDARNFLSSLSPHLHVDFL